MKQICSFRWAPKAKRFSASGGLCPPDQGLCPWTPLGALPQTPVVGSCSPRSACVSTPLFFTWRCPDPPGKIQQIQHWLLALEWIAQNRPHGTSVVCSDSQSLLKAISNASDDSLLIRRMLSGSSGRVVLQWIPGHVDVPTVPWTMTVSLPSALSFINRNIHISPSSIHGQPPSTRRSTSSETMILRRWSLTKILSCLLRSGEVIASHLNHTSI